MPSPGTWSLTWWPKEPDTFGDVYGNSSRTRRFPVHAAPAAWPSATLSAAWPSHSCTSFTPGASPFFSVLWGPRDPSNKFLFCFKKKEITWWKHFHLLVPSLPNCHSLPSSNTYPFFWRQTVNFGVILGLQGACTASPGSLWCEHVTPPLYICQN